MRELIQSGALGRIYSVRMFYGNGTARLVRDSPWRDRGAGVLPDLGPHLLVTPRVWFPAAGSWAFVVRLARRPENPAFAHDVVAADPADRPVGAFITTETR